MFDNRPTKAIDDIETHGTPGLSIRQADRVTVKSCRIGWGKNIPDYFSHALEAEDTTKLTLRKFRGEAAHPGRDKALSIH